MSSDKLRAAVRTSFARLSLLALALVACGGNSNEEPLTPHAVRHPKAKASAPAGPARLSSSPIARVPAGTFGPYLGMHAAGGLSVWASGEKSGRTWYAQPIGADGLAQGDTKRLGEAPNELGLVTIRPTRDRFAMLSTSKTSDGEVIRVSLLSHGGELSAGPVSVGRTTNSVLWIDVVPTARGLTVLWAASGAGRAEVWAAELGANAEPLGVPRLVARDAGAWQAVPFGKGLALAVTHIGKSNQHGPIELSLLTGSDPSPALTVNGVISADLDLDMAALGDRLLLAWSDHRGGENRVFSAVVDDKGKLVVPPAAATPPLGEQAVLRVVPPVEGGQHAYLAWESLDAQSTAYRMFQVAEIDRNGRTSGGRGSFEYWKMDGSMPEIVASARGAALLTLAPLCLRGAECSNASPTAPTYVELDSAFAVTSSEPLVTDNDSTSLAWNLTCPGPVCFALSAEGGVPSPVSLTRLERLESRYRAPAQRVELQAPPRVVADEALADTEPLAKIMLTETNAGTLLGWLTDFDPTTPWVRLTKPTADGRFEPLRARIDLQGFAPNEPFAALGPSENLSLRAHSLGSLALLGSPQQKDTLVAWAGLDGGQPQVFLTLVDKAGKKLTQRMLTHKLGDLSDVAVAPSGSDFLVAWVDERNKDPEVYATRVGRNLNRSAPEQRITQVTGSATDLSLVPTAGGALAIWADARESEDPGSADIYAAAVHGTDAARVGSEICLQKTRPHSSSPMAVPYGKGAFVAWLEAAADNEANAPASLSFVVLDDAAKPVGAVQSVSFGSSSPITLGLDCVNQLCHLVVSADAGSRGELFAVIVKDGKASAPVRIRSSNNAPSGVAPVVHGRDVFVSDLQQGRARLRRLQLEW